MPNVSFVANAKEIEAISAIAKRAKAIGITHDTMDTEMDVLATNANGCPLDLDKLLGFDDFNFVRKAPRNRYPLRLHRNRGLR